VGREKTGVFGGGRQEAGVGGKSGRKQRREEEGAKEKGVPGEGRSTRDKKKNC
jgi:hypothetical protein